MKVNSLNQNQEQFCLSPSLSPDLPAQFLPSSSSTHEPFTITPPPLTHAETELHQRALQHAKHFKQLQRELLEVISEVDRTRLFEKFLLTSTFSYGTQILGLSEDMVCTLTRLARVGQEIPEMKDAIQNGTLTLSNARKIASIITPQNQSEWIRKAQTLSQRKLEHEVAKSFPQEAVQEKSKYVSAHRLKLELGLEEEVLEMFHMAQDVLSQKKSRPVKLEDTLREVLKFYLDRHDPWLKAQRAQSGERLNSKAKSSAHRTGRQTLKKDNSPETQVQTSSAQGISEYFSKELPDQKSFPQKSLSPSSQLSPSSRKNSQTKSSAHTATSGVRRVTLRKPIKAQVNHTLQVRDRRRCQLQKPDGTLCGSSRWLQRHHRIPLAKGGSDSLENILLLCSGHHRLLHKFEKIRGKYYE